MKKDIKSHIQNRFTRRFYKENGLWYIDLPEFLAAGAGHKNDLLMVDGSDKMLDIMSRNTGEVVVQFSDFLDKDDPADGIMHMAEEGMNTDILADVNHAPIEYGRYYNSTVVVDNQPHKLRTWLCPVAEWVFGTYPKMIYVKVISYGK